MQLTLLGPSPRTSPDGSPTEATPSAPSLARLLEGGAHFSRQGAAGETRVLSLDPRDLPRGVCSTLNISEYPSEGAVSSSLLDVLERGPIPSRYFLSAKACAGIIRRAEKRGKQLPAHLDRLLREAAKTASE